MRHSASITPNRKREQITLLGIALLLFLLFICRFFYLEHQGPPKEIVSYVTASTLLVENLADVTPDTPMRNPYDSLCVPTYVNYEDGYYFLVDCYHDQVLYHENFDDPLTQWKVLTNDMHMGHTIASDGIVYLVDDTENNRILIFEKKDGCFIQTQVFNDIGNRPHYIQYDEKTATFYAWSSLSGELFCFQHARYDSRMYLTDVRKIEELDGVYVRSFTIIGNDIYFVSGKSEILKADLTTLRIKKRYPVPDTMAGMIQLMPISGGYLITISTDSTGDQSYATIIRCKRLEDLEKGEYTDVYESFIGGGTPYSITRLEDTYYLTEHRVPGHSVWSFQIDQNQLVNIRARY